MPSAGKSRWRSLASPSQRSNAFAGRITPLNTSTRRTEISRDDAAWALTTSRTVVEAAERLLGLILPSCSSSHRHRNDGASGDGVVKRAAAVGQPVGRSDGHLYRPRARPTRPDEAGLEVVLLQVDSTDIIARQRNRQAAERRAAEAIVAGPQMLRRVAHAGERLALKPKLPQGSKRPAKPIAQVDRHQRHREHRRQLPGRLPSSSLSPWERAGVRDRAVGCNRESRRQPFPGTGRKPVLPFPAPSADLL